MIEWALDSSADLSLIDKDLINKISEKYGFRIPINILEICQTMMVNEKRIELLENGTGYKLISKVLDLNQLEKEFLVLKEKEERLLSNLTQYVAELDQKWQIDDARKYLANYILKNGVAYNLFVGPYKQLTPEDDNKVEFDYFIKQYISHLLKEKGNNPNLGFLLDIVRGLVVYIGIFYNNDQKNTDKIFEGTSFFLDTNLLLRFLGYSFSARVEAANELIKAIRDDYGGTICVFEHNIREVTNALIMAANNLRDNKEVEDTELEMYRKIKHYSEADFRTAARNLRETIQQSHDFTIVQTDEIINKDNLKYCLDRKKAVEHILKSNPGWKRGKALENDIDSISYINAMRKGDYRVKFGGENRLPIFVTNNYALIRVVNEYVNDPNLNNQDVNKLATDNMPIISDNLLMCRLWIPKAWQETTPHYLTMLRNLAAVQNADLKFYERIRSMAESLEEKFKNYVIDLTEEKIEKINEILAKKSHGEYNKIDTTMLTVTI
jgi:predicted nucleic acid-binding protein